MLRDLDRILHERAVDEFFRPEVRELVLAEGIDAALHGLEPALHSRYRGVEDGRVVEVLRVLPGHGLEVSGERQVVADEHAVSGGHGQGERLVVAVPESEREPDTRVLNVDLEDPEEPSAVFREGVRISHDPDLPECQGLDERSHERRVRDHLVGVGARGNGECEEVLAPHERGTAVEHHLAAHAGLPGGIGRHMTSFRRAEHPSPLAAKRGNVTAKGEGCSGVRRATRRLPSPATADDASERHVRVTVLLLFVRISIDTVLPSGGIMRSLIAALVGLLVGASMASPVRARPGLRTFDAAGREVAVTTERGEFLRFTYHDRGRAIWDQRGNQIAFEREDGVVAAYAYDRGELRETRITERGAHRFFAASEAPDPVSGLRFVRSVWVDPQGEAVGVGPIPAKRGPPTSTLANAATFLRKAREQALAASKNRYGFAGYYFDAETGLYYAKSRYYDPEFGRFTTQDSVLGDVAQPPSLHRYAYAHNRPTVYTDPSGHCVGIFAFCDVAVAWAVERSRGINFAGSYANTPIGRGVNLGVHTAIESYGSAVAVPGNMRRAVADAVIPGGTAYVTGGSSDTSYAPARRAQISALNASADATRGYGERGALAAAATLSTPVVIVESMTSAPGGRAADALGRHVYHAVSAPSLEDATYEGVQAGGDFVAAFNAYGTVVAPLLPAPSRAPFAATQEANAAQLAKPRPGAAAALEAEGQVFPGRSVRRSTPRELEPTVQEAYNRIPPEQQSPFHGQCAEAGCLSDAIRAGVDPRGGTMSSVSVGKAPPRHGAALPPCPSCAFVLDEFGVTWVPPAAQPPLSPLTPLAPQLAGTAGREEQR